MDSINQIEIRINGLEVNWELFIIPSTSKVYIHGQEKDISREIIGQLLSLISKWDYEYVDDTVLDAETYIVKVYTATGVNQYFGSGKYPDNYSRFINLIKNVYEVEEPEEIL